MRTDQHDGFLLDRGFQVLLTAYPEVKRWINESSLQLHKFQPGALVRIGDKFHRFVDPWRRPQELLKMAFSPVASFQDKLKVASLRRRVCQGTLESLYDQPEQTTAQFLRDWGFSDQILERFFRPFLGGVFLDHELNTSSRMFSFVFRMFSLGDAALPASGMHAVPKQLAAPLAAGTIKLSSSVSRLAEAAGGASRVELESGESIHARRVIVATDAPAAQNLLSDQSFQRNQQSVACLYYAAKKPPIADPILVLNGDGQGPINNMCVPSQAAAGYAPAGQSLISVTVLAAQDPERLEPVVREQLKSWFGDDADGWRHLETQWIPNALPSQTPPALSPVIKPARINDGLFVCGDHRHTASIQGAMESGRLAGEAASATL